MSNKMNIPDTGQERIVVIGGGFAGIEFIKKIRYIDDYQIVLLDRQNYFTFQPLLYQVATAGLEPNSVAYPFRRLFRKNKNVHFRMAEVQEVSPSHDLVHTNIGQLEYDHLVIACGGQTNYFGNNPESMMNLKSLTGAVEMKNAILGTFEKALEADDPEEREKLFNIVITGGGPTGVELAGAFGEMKKFVLPKDYPQMDFDQLQIILLEGQDRVLPAMSEKASAEAQKYLEQLGVKVRLNKMVDGYEDDEVQLNDDSTIPSKNLIWTAGIKAIQIPGLDDAVQHKGNRLVVDKFNRLVGYNNIYAIGDIAAMLTPDTPNGHPMLAPVAIQQGQHLGENFLRIARNDEFAEFYVFQYRDKGTMATIGRNRAVVDAPYFKMQGTLAWFAWMFVHLITLVGFRNKLVTLIDWSYNYFTYDRALRLITTDKKLDNKNEKARKTEAAEAV
ncbi:MAG: NAD(P)/FAD-dependent oxidoreductase [Saprospiraceae bacterium]|nr:NAD(P)/FAD-dependent oxidoreductase [Saprospiraceae bacterium]